MLFSSNIGDETEIEAASNNIYNNGGPFWTVPELFLEKKQLIQALQQPLNSYFPVEDVNISGKNHPGNGL